MNRPAFIIAIILLQATYSFGQLPRPGIYWLDFQTNNYLKIKQGFSGCINQLMFTPDKVEIKLEHISNLSNLGIKKAVVSVNSREVKVLFIADSLALKKYEMANEPYMDNSLGVERMPSTTLLIFDRVGKSKNQLTIQYSFEEKFIDTRIYNFLFWKEDEQKQKNFYSFFSVSRIEQVYHPEIYGGKKTYVKKETWVNDTLEAVRRIDEFTFMFDQFKQYTSNNKIAYTDIIPNTLKEPVPVYERMTGTGKIIANWSPNEYAAIVKKYKSGWAKIDIHRTSDSRITDWIVSRGFSQAAKVYSGYVFIKPLKKVVE